MALTQSAQGKVTALDYSMGRDCFPGVGRTAGVETTVVTQQRAQAGLVAINKKNEQATH
jgi:hypothetical protein